MPIKAYAIFWQAKLWWIDCRFHGRNIKIKKLSGENFDELLGIYKNSSPSNFYTKWYFNICTIVSNWKDYERLLELTVTWEATRDRVLEIHVVYILCYTFQYIINIKKFSILKKWIRDRKSKKYANKLEIKEMWKRIKVVLKCC